MNRKQFMQTTSGWAMMAEPMQSAMPFNVPVSGAITLPVTMKLLSTTRPSAHGAHSPFIINL
jgi:hypothetical protein